MSVILKFQSILSCCSMIPKIDRPLFSWMARVFILPIYIESRYRSYPALSQCALPVNTPLFNVLAVAHIRLGLLYYCIFSPEMVKVYNAAICRAVQSTHSGSSGLPVCGSRPFRMAVSSSRGRKAADAVFFHE